jgi:hypothetical protein
MSCHSDYSNQAITHLFEETGAFYAFSDKQFQEKQKDGVNYVSCGGGLIVPEGKVQSFFKQLSRIKEKSIKLDLESNGKEEIIKRELVNHECYYVNDCSDCVDALEPYGITQEEVNTVFKATSSSFSY